MKYKFTGKMPPLPISEEPPCPGCADRDARIARLREALMWARGKMMRAADMAKITAALADPPATPWQPIETARRTEVIHDASRDHHSTRCSVP